MQPIRVSVTRILKSGMIAEINVLSESVVKVIQKVTAKTKPVQKSARLDANVSKDSHVIPTEYVSIKMIAWLTSQIQQR